MTYVTAFENENILGESTFNLLPQAKEPSKPSILQLACDILKLLVQCVTLQPPAGCSHWRM